jgi:uncharacterized membrane protein YhiD involved in acid resistance
MNSVLKFLNLESGQGGVLGVWELVIALLLTLTCSLLIGAVYRYTHRSPAYSQSYVHSLVLTSMVTALIMLVIGSNLARAFSLVGALSIIRFRNAVKETRDVGYIFFAMAVAMACGTRFYLVAILATVVICLTMLSLHLLDYASNVTLQEKLLRVRMPVDLDAEAGLEPVLRELFDTFSLVLSETSKQGLCVDYLYSVRPKEAVHPRDIFARIAEVNENLKITYHHGQHVEGH